MGTDDEPVMDLALSTDGFRFRDYVLDRIEADVAYTGRMAEGDVVLWKDSLQVLTLDGELPLDLSFNARRGPLSRRGDRSRGRVGPVAAFAVDGAVPGL